MRAVVVGAGIAGLMAGRTLARAGHEVIVLDKGTSVGGRMATRRIGEATFDHGAQFFTVQLSALGLDFQPARAPDRARLLAALERGGDAAAAAQLGSLLAEIQAHPPLAQDGRIPPAQP